MYVCVWLRPMRQPGRMVQLGLRRARGPGGRLDRDDDGCTHMHGMTPVWFEDGAPLCFDDMHAWMTVVMM